MPKNTYNRIRTISGFDGSGRGDCLAEGTRIRMADTSLKPIEKIIPGDLVLSMEGRPQKVISVFERRYTGNIYEIHTKDGFNPIRMTADHKMAVHANAYEYSWKQPYEMNELDYLICERENRTFPNSDVLVKLNKCRTGFLTKIELIKSEWVEDLAVYDLQVEEDRSFFAENLGSSNCSVR